MSFAALRITNNGKNAIQEIPAFAGMTHWGMIVQSAVTCTQKLKPVQLSACGPARLPLKCELHSDRQAGLPEIVILEHSLQAGEDDKF